MSNALNRFFNTFPKVFNAQNNPILYALLYAIALSDDDVENSIEEAKKQLFVKTASGKYLDRLANSRGVRRPAVLGLNDDDFRNLIPNLSLKPKVIRKAFYDTADVFWGPRFSRANVTSGNVAPFDINLDDTFEVTIDGVVTHTVKVLAGDIQDLGFATAEEVKSILDRIPKITTEILEDAVTNEKSINIRTNTPGSTGNLDIASSVIATALDITAKNYDILDLNQRVVVYNITANQLLIELPATVPALRRVLKGSHHFHTDGTLEPPKGVNQGIWRGSFLFNPTGTDINFTITSQRCNIQQAIQKDQVYPGIAVNDSSSFTSASGELIFGFGTATQEGPVKYRGIPNSGTILLDPSYTFKFDHSSGEAINAISQRSAFSPNKNGKDLAVYLTSPSGAREIVQAILESLAAAGIFITFEILSPKYKYLIDSPYISSDDAPSE